MNKKVNLFRRLRARMGALTPYCQPLLGGVPLTLGIKWDYGVPKYEDGKKSGAINSSKPSKKGGGKCKGKREAKNLDNRDRPTRGGRELEERIQHAGDRRLMGLGRIINREVRGEKRKGYYGG